MLLELTKRLAEHEKRRKDRKKSKNDTLLRKYKEEVKTLLEAQQLRKGLKKNIIFEYNIL